MNFCNLAIPIILILFAKGFQCQINNYSNGVFNILNDFDAVGTDDSGLLATLTSVDNIYCLTKCILIDNCYQLIFKDNICRLYSLNEPLELVESVGSIYYYATKLGPIIRNKILITQNVPVIKSMTFLKNGDIATGSSQGYIHIWDRNTGDLKNTSFTNYSDSLSIGFNPSIKSLTTLPNGDIVCGSYRSLLIIDVNTLAVKNVITTTDTSFFKNLVFLPNGDLVATTSLDITIWDINSGELKSKLNRHSFDSPIYGFSVSENYLVASSTFQEIIIRNLNTSSETVILNAHPMNAIYSLAFLKNGSLVSGDGNYTIKIWNSENGALLNTITTIERNIKSLMVLNNGDLVVGFGMQNFKVYDMTSGFMKANIKTYLYGSQTFSVNNNGDFSIAYGNGFNGYISAWGF